VWQHCFTNFSLDNYFAAFQSYDVFYKLAERRFFAREGPMYFEQFYLGCLAHASYLLVSEGEAVVVDPQRDIELYLRVAEQHGAKIRHIFETHLHADFVSGHRELASRTGAKIYIGERAAATFSHRGVRDGFELQVGKVRISVLETPGHTMESVCLVITDQENRGHVVCR
jgi:glyoxylase-like metal-dependent hydrolase (beta-lactamase superfamily II)